MWRQGETRLTVSHGASVSFLYFKAQKIEQIVEEWRTNLPRFQGAFPHHVWVESLSYLEGVCEFWLMTRDTFFPPIGKRF